MTNTEPQGIKDIREAKADYIESLSRLKDAEAAKVKAETELVEAKVAYEQIQNQIAQCEADEVAAKLKVTLKEQEELLARAEAALQAALKDLALSSEKLTTAEQQAIEKYTEAYEKYIDAEKTVRDKQQALWIATYQWTGAGDARSLEETKASYEKAIAKAEDQIAKHQAKLEEYSEVAESERAKYDVWKAEYDAYADSSKNMDYEIAKIKKEQQYFETDQREAFDAFILAVTAADTKVGKAVANASMAPFAMNFTGDKAFALPTQKVNNGVVGKFTGYVDNFITVSGKEGNKISIANNKMSVVFQKKDSAQAQIFGTDKATDWSLSSIIDALKRDSVIVEKFITDTTGLAKAVAKAENLYKTTLDTLKAGVEAYPGVIKAKADSAAAGAALRAEYAKFLAQQAEVDSAASDVLKQVKAYKQAIADGEKEDFNINKIVKAINEFSTLKYNFFETPDSKKDSLHVITKIGSTPEKDVYKTIFFGDLKKAGFVKDTDQDRWQTATTDLLIPKFMDVATYMLNAEFVKDLYEEDEISWRPSEAEKQYLSNANAISSVDPLLDAVNQALDPDTHFSSFTDSNIDTYTIYNLNNWGWTKVGKDICKVYRSGEKSGFKAAEQPFETSALKAAEKKSTEAKQAVNNPEKGAYANFYKNFYCPFWAIKYDKSLFNNERPTKGLVDSLEVRYKENTFAGLINFDYTEKPWNNGKIDYEQINLLDNSELDIILNEFAGKPYYGSQQLYQGDKGEHKWTLYLKSLAAKAVLADAQNYSDNKKTLAALEEVVNKVKDAYNAAVTKSKDDSKIALADSLVNEFLGKDIIALANLGKTKPYEAWKAGSLDDFRVVVSGATQADFQANFCVEGEFFLGGTQLEAAETLIPDYAEKIGEWDESIIDIHYAQTNLGNFMEALSEYVETIAALDGYTATGDVDAVAAKVDKAWKKFLGKIEDAIAKFEGDKRSAEQALAKLEAGYDPQQVAIEKAQDELDKAIAALDAAETTLKIAENAYNQVIKNHE